MKLTELWTHSADPVRTDDGTPMTRFHEGGGHAMSLAQGIVTITGRGIATSRLVPLSNVASMTPAAKE